MGLEIGGTAFPLEQTGVRIAQQQVNILESQGKKADALKLYQEVKEKYFNSMAYQTIDAYIERVSE